jgi:hypothetical protein
MAPVSEVPSDRIFKKTIELEIEKQIVSRSMTRPRKASDWILWRVWCPLKQIKTILSA